MRVKSALTVLLVCGSLFATAAQAKEDVAVPDFSGLWARTTFGFDLPPPGTNPSPLRNLARRPNGTSDAFRLVGDYKNPILKPEAAEIVRQHGEISLTGSSYPDLSNECRPLPPPYVLRIAQMQMVQQKDKITILYIQDHQFRQVRLNAKHPEHVTPSWNGDSVGHYEGDTLVVDTVCVKPRVGSMIDLYGTPYSAALHVVERYRLVDAATARADQERSEREYGRPTTEPVYVDVGDTRKGLKAEFTVEDPNMFTTAWSSSVTYRPSNYQWIEIACPENQYDYYRDLSKTIPRADKPDF